MRNNWELLYGACVRSTKGFSEEFPSNLWVLQDYLSQSLWFIFLAYVPPTLKQISVLFKMKIKANSISINFLGKTKDFKILLRTHVKKWVKTFDLPTTYSRVRNRCRAWKICQKRINVGHRNLPKRIDIHKTWKYL